MSNVGKPVVIISTGSSFWHRTRFTFNYTVIKETPSGRLTVQRDYDQHTRTFKPARNGEIREFGQFVSKSFPDTLSFDVAKYRSIESARNTKRTVLNKLGELRARIEQNRMDPDHVTKQTLASFIEDCRADLDEAEATLGSLVDNTRSW